VKVASFDNAAELCDPLVAREPLQPPDALHAVAFVELQVRVVGPPLGTVVGSAVRTAVGTTFTVTDAV
jgi:hypothetical protein